MSTNETLARIRKLIGAGAGKISIDGHSIDARDLQDLLLIEDLEKNKDLTERVNGTARASFFTEIETSHGA